MQCPDCGAELRDNAKFCHECGKEILRCTNCGAAIRENEKFCHECGRSTAPEKKIKIDQDRISEIKRKDYLNPPDGKPFIDLLAVDACMALATFFAPWISLAYMSRTFSLCDIVSGASSLVDQLGSLASSKELSFYVGMALLLLLVLCLGIVNDVYHDAKGISGGGKGAWACILGALAFYLCIMAVNNDISKSSSSYLGVSFTLFNCEIGVWATMALGAVSLFMRHNKKKQSESKATA